MPLNPRLPVVIVLAAGRGERFAASGATAHKLQALLSGKPVLEHVLDAVRASSLPFYVVGPSASRPGMGDSIAAGVQATLNATAWLILPADLPLISASTLRSIAFAAPCAVTVPVYQGQRGHPVRFGLECASDLLELHGHQGAAQLILAFKATDSIAILEVGDAGCVTDIDTLDDLAFAEKLLASRTT